MEETAETEQTLSFEGYKTIEVYGGDLSGHRELNIAVGVGFGNREFWSYPDTNTQIPSSYKYTYTFS